jgi:hypothetical protein
VSRDWKAQTARNALLRRLFRFCQRPARKAAAAAAAARTSLRTASSVSSGEPQPFPQNSAQVFGTGARITSSASGSCYPSTSTGYNLIRTPVSTAFVVRTASIPRALGSSRTAADGWSQTPHRSSAFLGAVRSQSGPSRVTGFKKQPRTLLVDTTSTCLGFQWTTVNKKQTHTHREGERGKENVKSYSLE